MKDEPVFEYHAKEIKINIKHPDDSDKTITINSGWSFGTGEHETTRLCIKALEELAKTEDINAVLDIGCGSGILSIASSLLGAKNVHGIDIDSRILGEARANCKKNNLPDSVIFSNETVSEITSGFSLVIANILLKTIESLLPDITQRVSENGFFIASGIRKSEQDEAAKLIESFGFKAVKAYSEEEWTASIFRKQI